MSLESFNNNPEEKKNSIETFKVGKFRCLKNMLTMGILSVGLYWGGDYIKKHNENEQKYKDFLEHSITEQDKIEIIKSKEKIQFIFGDYSEKIFNLIEIGNKRSFFEKKEAESPKVTGFDIKEGSQADNIQKYVLPEKYKVFPRGWVNGEIDDICLVNWRQKIKNNDGYFDASGELGNKYFSNLPGKSLIIYAYGDNKAYSVDKDGKTIHINNDVIEHELGHANDWVNDNQLKINDRYKLLIECYERVVSEDSFTREQKKYHELYNDGSSEGLYRSVLEYWADICQQFFSNPSQFQKTHPKDFELVKKIIEKTDPDFNIFDKNRGAFDSYTGDLKDIYKK